MRSIVIAILLLGATAPGVAQFDSWPAELPHRPDPVLKGKLKVRIAADHALSAQQALADMGLRIVRPVLPFEQSLTFTLRQQRSVQNARRMNLDEALIVEERLLRSFVVEYDRPEIPPEQMIARLRIGCGPIECAAPWCIQQLCAEPNDPERGRQDLLRTVNAYAAWDVESGSDSVVIGIIDSGVRTEHEDLVDAIHKRTSEIPGNGIDDDSNGYIDDYRGYNFSWKEDSTSAGDAFNPDNGHGTGVAGLCDATTNNGVGIAGLAGKCQIFPLRTMPKGTTGIVFGYEALMYAAVNGFDVVNCSWGGQSPSCIDQDVITYTIARGTAVVAAAGNHYSASPFYPAGYKGVLSVGVVDASDNVVPMTGRGPTVDVMAPGHSSWTTSNNGGYDSFCCTSGSSPLAAAVVALVRSKHPELAPLQACAVVRDAIDEAPWATVPAEIDRLQLPRGRLNALKAVTASPDTLVSIEVDTIELAAKSGSQRWNVGDTLTARIGLVNRLAPWTLKVIGVDGISGIGRDALRAVSSEGVITQQQIGVGERFFLPAQDFVVSAETDTAAYVHMRLLGTDRSGAAVNRRYGYAVTPAPAFTTLANHAIRVSIGDRARIGNTDLERGQGEGLRFQNFCGQLYEGGLMVHANGRTVDAVRSLKRNNDHFRPLRRFVGRHAITGTVSDADAPDSLRIGVEVEFNVELDTSKNVLRVDVTLTNRSDTTLHDLAAAWFYDWDLGSQPARNKTYRNGALQVVTAVGERQPMVVIYNDSPYSDGRPIQAGLDNTTTYGGFATETKTEMLKHSERFNFEDVNDVATVSGMRFETPLPPGHRRSFRHVVVIDTSIAAITAILPGETWTSDYRPTDTLFAAAGTSPVFPNPASSVVYVPVERTPQIPVVFTVCDLTGRTVLMESISTVPSRYPFLQPINVGELGSGSYYIRTNDGVSHNTWPLIIVR
ncbi:MAG: S8 family serine peptidase [Candidatus Kapaibacterium sp.]